MKILIAVPTYKRPYVLEKRAWYFLKDLKNADVKIFCDEDEEIYYEQVAGDHVVAGAKQGRPNGLIAQLNYIGKYAVDNGYDIVWKVDDKQMMHKGGVRKKDIGPQVDEYLLNIIDKFKEGADAIGTSKAMEYLHSDKGGYKPRYTPFSASYFVRAEHLVLDEEIFSMDELQMYLHLAVKGSTNVYTSYEMYIDCPMGKFDGGLQMFNRLEESEKCLDYIMKKYPEIKPKENGKGNIDIGNRLDIKHYRDLYKK